MTVQPSGGRIRSLIPRCFREGLRGLAASIRDRIHAPPAEVVKGNTREGFDYFWSHDDFVERNYLDPARRMFYETLASHCARLPGYLELRGIVRLLDVGCGTGHALKALAGRLPATAMGMLYGLDYSVEAVRRARRLLPEARFLVGDLYASGLPSDRFDWVFCLETLEHLRDPEAAMREILRVCRPGGTVLVTVPDGERDRWEGHIQFWTLDGFREWIATFGDASATLMEDESTIIAWVRKPGGGGG